MGFGITGFVKAATKKALIRYVDPEFNESRKEAGLSEMTLDDFKVQGDGTIIGGLTAYAKESIGGYLASFIGIIQDVKPDVRKAESHKYRSTVTQYAVEDGTILSQHIIQQPIQVTLQFEETNAGIGKMLSGITNLVSMATGISFGKSTFEQLTEVWERKIPVEIVTENRIYKNMVIENLPIMHKSPYKGALQIMVDFIQLSTYQIEIAEKKGITNAINNAANAVKSGGKQQLENISNKPDAKAIADAQSRVSQFKAEDMYKYTPERIAQQKSDVELLQKTGNI